MEPLYKHANLVRAVYSYLKSSVTGSPEVSSMPLAIGVELTNNCNLFCPECATGSGKMVRERGFMDIELFKRVMKELSPYLYNVNLYFQGEPMMHPGFFLFLENSISIHTTVSTNGHFLSGEAAEKIVVSGLDKLIISLDGADQETYTLYRKNGDFGKVLRSIEYVSDARKRLKSHLKIEIQFLVGRHNEHQINLVRSIAERYKLSLRLKSMQLTDQKNIGAWLPDITRYSRYKFKKGEYVIKNPLPDRCARAWFNPVITWDGKVVPCCFDKNAEHVLGDLSHDSFRDIWNGPKYRIFRKSILSGRGMIEICRNCSSGLTGVRS